MEHEWQGGCTCGAVRYQLKSAPYEAGWFETTDHLPRHDKFRPDTRGLEGRSR